MFEGRTKASPPSAIEHNDDELLTPLSVFALFLQVSSYSICDNVLTLPFSESDDTRIMNIIGVLHHESKQDRRVALAMLREYDCEMGTTWAFLIQSYVDTKAAVLRIALKHNFAVCFDPEMRVEIKRGIGLAGNTENEAEAMDVEAESGCEEKRQQRMNGKGIHFDDLGGAGGAGMVCPLSSSASVSRTARDAGEPCLGKHLRD